MIVNFDRNPRLSIDEKIQSLMESVQMALNEVPLKLSQLVNDMGFISKDVVDALTASDVGAVPTTRKVNNKALSSDIALTASDIGLDYITLVNAQSYNTTTANTWQYTGYSFTVPANHVYIARLYTQYANGKPIGLGFHTTTSFVGANTAPIYNIENSLGVLAYTSLLEPGTYYVWSKRNNTGNNTYTVRAIDLSIT